MTENDKYKIIKRTVSCPECGAEMVCTHEDPNTTRSTGVKKATSGPKALTGGFGHKNINTTAVYLRFNHQDLQDVYANVLF